MEKLKNPRKPDLRHLNYESEIWRKDAQNMRQYQCLFHRGFRLSWYLSYRRDITERGSYVVDWITRSQSSRWSRYYPVQPFSKFCYSPDIITYLLREMAAQRTF